MKICLINNLYKPYRRGGAENVVELIAEGLKKDGPFGYAQGGHEVFIITTKPVFKEQRTKNKEQKIFYINGLFFNLNKLPKVLRLFWHFVDMFDVGSYWKVKRIFKKENPDVIMTHNLKGISYLIPKLIKNLNIKHIHTLHDIQLLHPSGLMFYGKEKRINGFLGKFYQGLCRSLFGSPDVVISPSRWLMWEHADRGFFRESEKVVLPNPTSPPAPLLIRRGEKEARFRFLYVGQIEEHKGVLFLIKAFCHFERSEKSLEGGLKPELLIVGDGSQIKKAQKLIGQDKNIKLLGRLKNSEVMDLMQSSDCLIMPSLCYENSPTVIYEAMSNGLPVIASRIGGIPELLDNNGLLFEPSNENGLVDQMKWAVEHRDELQGMAERGGGKIKDYKVKNYIEKLMRL